ncbi:MAG: type II toxin-antitoxin system PemK/MazF family toxin [Planctomycetaceae bacterium]
MPSKRSDSNGTDEATHGIPQRGDLVRVTPPELRASAGPPPLLALVVSPAVYNQKTGLMLVCPVREIDTGYPFGVQLPSRLEVAGCVLADQVRSLDWRTCGMSVVAHVPAGVTSDALQLLQILLGEERSPGNQQPSSFPGPVKPTIR